MSMSFVGFLCPTKIEARSGKPNLLSCKIGDAMSISTPSKACKTSTSKKNIGVRRKQTSTSQDDRMSHVANASSNEDRLCQTGIGWPTRSRLADDEVTKQLQNQL